MTLTDEELRLIEADEKYPLKAQALAAEVRRLQNELAFARKEQQQAVFAAKIFGDDNERLKAALKFELDACFCDDRDGNCNPPAAPECDRCLRIRKVLK